MERGQRVRVKSNAPMCVGATGIIREILYDGMIFVKFDDWQGYVKGRPISGGSYRPEELELI